MADFYIGEIRIFPFNFAPYDWAVCAGQQMPLQQNAALYSLLGVTYGGNGSTNFNLPNLLSRVPVGAMISGVSPPPGLTARSLGLAAGSESVTLNGNNLPANSVSVKAATDAANASTPANGSYLATGKSGIANTNNYFTGTPTGTVNLGGVTSGTGSNQPVPVMQPYLALNFCIALQGIYPQRP